MSLRIHSWQSINRAWGSFVTKKLEFGHCSLSELFPITKCFVLWDIYACVRLCTLKEAKSVCTCVSIWPHSTSVATHEGLETIRISGVQDVSAHDRLWCRTSPTLWRCSVHRCALTLHFFCFTYHLCYSCLRVSSLEGRPSLSLYNMWPGVSFLFPLFLVSRSKEGHRGKSCTDAHSTITRV